MIYATKGQKKRQFDDQTWKEMPEHKYGWTLSADEPEEIAAIRAHKVTPIDVKNNPDLAGLEGKTVGIPVTKNEVASEIEKIENELKTPGIHHMVAKKLAKRLQELKGQVVENLDGDDDATNSETVTTGVSQSE